MNADRPPLLVIAGPTGVGKSELSLTLAKELSGEIISADSMQVYRGMDIGTAKLMPEDRQGIPHHLLDILDPDQEFDVSLFQELALEAMEKIRGRGHLPILVGGTGFYLQSVTRGVNFTENAVAPEYVKELTDRFGKRDEHTGISADEVGQWDIQGLFALLREADPETAAVLPPENVKRVLRALEYRHATGEKLSVHNERERARPSPYRLGFFVLTKPRQELYQSIDKRVDEMFAQGFLEEARGLYEKYGNRLSITASKALGYRELYAFFEGKTDFDEAVRLIKRNTRHFAKRQLTWFKREQDAVWIEKQASPCATAAAILKQWD